MSSPGNIATFIREHKTLFVAVLIGLFLLELEIFAMAVTKSGKQSVLRINDKQGQIVYELDGRYAGAFNRERFETTFGPLSEYQVRRITKEKPFPFRAWFVAAVGLPLGGMLILAFVVRAFVAIFEGDKHHVPKNDETSGPTASNRLDQTLEKISRLNIFVVGFIVFMIVISYWILPNVIVYIGKLGVETIGNYRWIFLGGAGILICIVIWVIYLRYLLAKKHVESQVALDKYRLQLEFDKELRVPLQLEANKSTSPVSAVEIEEDSATKDPAQRPESESEN